MYWKLKPTELSRWPPESIGDARVARIDQTVCPEPIGEASHAIGDVGVVPAVVDDLHEHGVRDILTVHVGEEHLERRLVRHVLVREVRRVRVGDGVASGVVRPDVHVGVDDGRAVRPGAVLGHAARLQGE